MVSTNPQTSPSGRTADDGATRDDVSGYLALLEHELRTPLAVTSSAAQTLIRLLEEPDLDREQINHVGVVIRRHSRLASRLIGRLSVAADISRGTIELATELVDLAQLVGDSVTDVADFVLPTREVTVSADGPIPAVVDPAAVTEIVFNLLGNADKYSPAKSPIEVRVERTDLHGRVIVRNHGSGVTPTNLSTIFDAYVQGDARNAGVGLGLYVSRGLARAHGGDLVVRPAARDGSEFVLELPVKGG